MSDTLPLPMRSTVVDLAGVEDGANQTSDIATSVARSADRTGFAVFVSVSGTSEPALGLAGNGGVLPADGDVEVAVASACAAGGEVDVDGCVVPAFDGTRERVRRYYGRLLHEKVEA